MNPSRPKEGRRLLLLRAGVVAGSLGYAAWSFTGRDWVGMAVGVGYSWLFGGADLIRAWRLRNGIPIRRTNEPVRATKRARLSGWGNLLAFLPLVSGPPYRVDERAVCTAGRHHKAPNPYCSCGFYAARGPALGSWLLRRSGTVTLEVEFYGRVVRHGNVYRGERQRVLRVTLDRCRLCPRFRRKSATGVVWNGVLLAEEPVPACSSCAKMENPGCPDAFMPIEDVRGALGTEVVAKGRTKPRR